MGETTVRGGRIALAVFFGVIATAVVAAAWMFWPRPGPVGQALAGCGLDRVAGVVDHEDGRPVRLTVDLSGSAAGAMVTVDDLGCMLAGLDAPVHVAEDLVTADRGTTAWDDVTMSWTRLAPAVLSVSLTG